MPASKQREVIIEYAQYGSTLRVTAVDAETGLEVVFQVPANISMSEIERLAINKLTYVAEKQKKT